MTPTAALLDHAVPDDTCGTAELATDAILILSKGCEAASTIADALANVGITASLATTAMVEIGVRSGGIAVVVMTGGALRSLDIDALVAALADQPPGLEAMIIAVDTADDDLARRLARLDAATTLVPVGPPTSTMMALHVVRAALRARRRQRESNAYAARCAAAELATHRLADSFDARVEQRAAEVAAAQHARAVAGNRAIAEMSELVLFTTDANGQVDDIDDRFCELTALSIPDLLAIAPDGLCHPDDLPLLVRVRDEAPDTRSFDLTVRIRHPGGQYKWWRARARPRLDADDAIIGWFGTVEDVDLRVRARESLKASEEIHRLSVESSDQVVWSAAADGTIVSIGDGLFDRLGIARDEWMAMSFAERVHPIDFERAVAIHLENLKNGMPADHRVRMRCGDGSYRWWRARYAPLLDVDSRVIRWHGVLEDVDALARAEEKLRESEERYRFAIQLSNLVTYTMTSDGRIDAMDNLTANATGFAVEEIIAKGSDFTWHPDHLAAIRAARLEAMVTGQYDQTHLMDNRDGTYRWWRSRAKAYRDTNGKIVRWHGTLENVDELKRAEERLRESEDRHSFCISLSKLVTYTATTDGIIDSIDATISAATGIDTADIIGTLPTSFCHPDDVAGLMDAALSAKHHDIFDHSYRIRDANGDYRWYRSRSQPRRDEAGNVGRWYGTLEDIDALRRAEEQLRDSEELHRRAVELSNLIVWTAAPNGNFMSISPRIFKILGLTRAMTPSLRPLSLVHPDDLPATTAALKAGLSDGVAADFRLRLRIADGSYRWWRLRSSPLRDDDGTIIRWYGTIDDFDELTRSEERLRDSEERYRYTVELSEQIVFTASAAGKITSIGSRWTQVTGLSANDVLGAGLFTLIHHDDCADVAYRWALRIADGVGADISCRIADASGAYRWWRIRAAQRQDAAGDVIGWYGTIEDIDIGTRSELKLKQVQAEMVHMSRLNAMGAMASTLAQELNQPLSAVVNYIAGSRRLLEGTTGPAVHKVQDAMRSAQDCADRAGEIIRRVRQQVSRGDNQKSVVIAGSLVKDACNVALINAGELGINLIVDLDPAVNCVLGDDIQLQQILINLLRNAVDAVAGRAERRIVVSTRLSGSYVAFAVDDTGPGVATAMEGRLFEPFESSKPDGMGMGLSISRTIAESHGGRLEYERSVLGGARFTILLPSCAEPEDRP